MENRSVYSASQSSAIEIPKVLRNTYMLLAMTLAFSAVTAFVSFALGPEVIGRGTALIMMLAAFGTLFILHKKANSSAGIGLVFLFTGLLGASLGPTLSMYVAAGSGALIFQALGMTALIFFTLSAYVLVTKKDFSFLGGFLMIGLVFAIVASLIMLFVPSMAGYLAINAVIVFLMSGFILYDTSRIVNGGETNYILATVSLYLNIYNLFTSLLALLNLAGDD